MISKLVKKYIIDYEQHSSVKVLVSFVMFFSSMLIFLLAAVRFVVVNADRMATYEGEQFIVLAIFWWASILSIPPSAASVLVASLGCFFVARTLLSRRKGRQKTTYDDYNKDWL